MSFSVIIFVILGIFVIFYVFKNINRFTRKTERNSINKLDNMTRQSSMADEPSSRESESDSNALILLFNELPGIDEEEIVKRISEIEPIEGQVSIFNGGGKEHPKGEQVGWGFIKFSHHTLELIGLELPVPTSTIEGTIYPSGWSEEATNPMRKHRVHTICFYKGKNPDPVEQMIALYKVASCFVDKGLLGVLDETARNCIPGNFVNTMFEPGMLDECRKNIPLEFWTNLIKYSRPNGGVWLCTKGNHRFGIKDFAYLGKIEELKETRELFNMLFNYSRQSGISFNAGETAQIGESLALRFSTPIEYQEYLESPLGTLVVQKIDVP